MSGFRTQDSDRLQLMAFTVLIPTQGKTHRIDGQFPLNSCIEPVSTRIVGLRHIPRLRKGLRLTAVAEILLCIFYGLKATARRC